MPFDHRSIAVLIPARYGSTRFPGKPLVPLGGKPILQHIYEAAERGSGVTTVRVVTDDDRIRRVVQDFGGQVAVVDGPCRTGTDRVAAGIRDLDCEIVVNWQADEVPRDATLLDDLLCPFVRSEAPMGTLMRKLSPAEDPTDPSVVKVVTDHQGRALYFSRAPIPYFRDRSAKEDRESVRIHLGLYIFRRDVLLRFAELPSGVWEQAEQLEQLRALEFGIPIQVWETHASSLRIDTPNDLERAKAEFSSIG